MRMTTLAGVALLALSSAAIAQVASTPIEQKTPAQTPTNTTDDAPATNTTDDAPPTNAADMPGNSLPSETTTDAPVNASPPAGDPMTSSGKPPK